MSMRLTRRQLLGSASAGAGVFVLQGCSPSLPVSFDHGVASGDPLVDAVVIWTRVTPLGPPPQSVPVRWQLALDEDFDDIVVQGETSTSADRDFTVKIDVTGLVGGTGYFYRFLCGGTNSPTGRTRTLPTGDVEQLKLAVVSCSNYPQGFFNAYREISKRTYDAVLHLGDYFYEYPAGGYANETAIAMGRQVVPETELLKLSDYRLRHALYKADPDSQAAHAAHPFICVWDDHEIANDAWEGGAENHNDGEGDWETRKQAAITAYREWMPIRDPEPGQGRSIYRRFDVGKLASLIMLDTRLEGRDKQLEYEKDMIYRSVPFSFVDPDNPVALLGQGALRGVPAQAVRMVPVPFDVTGEEPQPVLDWATISTIDPQNLPEGLAYLPDAERFRADVLEAPDRTILGARQEAWLDEQLRDSVNKGIAWQVLGQQLLVGKLTAPDLRDAIDPSKPSFLSPERQRLLTLLGQLNLPLNLDAWDGYWAARERLFTSIAAADANVVVLAGDTHNSWAFELSPDGADAPVAVEFATPGVTSPGLETYLPVDPSIVAERFVARNPELQFLDSAQRGFMEVTITPEAVIASWQFIDTVLAKDYTVMDGPRYKVVQGSSVLELV